MKRELSFKRHERQAASSSHLRRSLSIGQRHEVFKFTANPSQGESSGAEESLAASKILGIWFFISLNSSRRVLFRIKVLSGLNVQSISKYHCHCEPRMNMLKRNPFDGGRCEYCHAKMTEKDSSHSIITERSREIKLKLISSSSKIDISLLSHARTSRIVKPENLG